MGIFTVAYRSFNNKKMKLAVSCFVILSTVCIFQLAEAIRCYRCNIVFGDCDLENHIGEEFDCLAPLNACRIMEASWDGKTGIIRKCAEILSSDGLSEDRQAVCNTDLCNKNFETAEPSTPTAKPKTTTPTAKPKTTTPTDKP